MPTIREISIKCLFAVQLFFVVGVARPCSMFKITLWGKTMVGNNEDAWRVNSRIWFETGKDGRFGSAYVGHDDGFPQGGINEAGLVYDGFKVYRRTLRPATGKKKIEDFGSFLKSILQRCATVQEVQYFVQQYDRERTNGSMLLFVDKNGNYLVVEADTTILGHDQKYVLSNFCPSLTPNTNDVKIGRYRKGKAFLQNKEDTSLAFCTAMMDTMHECRARLGDGTTYTTIYDLKEGLIYLYFYHDYRHCITFDLRRELEKGDHSILVSSLFPLNPEYVRFTQFKTPFNDGNMRLTLTLSFFFFVLSQPCFLLIFLRNLKKAGKIKYLYIWPVLLTVNLGLAFYTFNLESNQSIYYFNRPYKEDGMWLLNLSSYFPTGLMILFIPLIFLTSIYYKNYRNRYHLILLVLNTLSYGVLLYLFGYWGLYVAS